MELPFNRRSVLKLAAAIGITSSGSQAHHSQAMEELRPAPGAQHVETTQHVGASEHHVGLIGMQDATTGTISQAKLEIYADADKAVLWVTPMVPGGSPMRRIVFRQPAIADSFAILCAVVSDRDVPAGTEKAMCPVCDGHGWYLSVHGDQVDCPDCNCLGYVPSGQEAAL